MNIFTTLIFSLFCTGLYGQYYRSLAEADADPNFNPSSRIMVNQMELPEPSSPIADPDKPSDWYHRAQQQANIHTAQEFYKKAMLTQAETMPEQMIRIKSAEERYMYSLTYAPDKVAPYSHNILHLYQEAFNRAQRAHDVESSTKFAKILQDMHRNQAYADRVLLLEEPDLSKLENNYQTRYRPVLMQQASHHNILAIAELHNNRPQHALEEFLKAHALDDSNFNVECTLAELFVQTGRSEDLRAAKNYADKALELARAEIRDHHPAAARDQARATEISAQIRERNRQSVPLIIIENPQELSFPEPAHSSTATARQTVRNRISRFFRTNRT